MNLRRVFINGAASVSVSIALTSPCHAFVLLSGTSEAKLPVSPEVPKITFIYEHAAPTITNKTDFAGGQYKDLSDDELFPIMVRLAMDQWNNTPGSYARLELSESGSPKFDGEDRVFSIVFQEQNASSAALAFPTIEDKVIVDCDIAVGNRSSTATYLAYTVMHELGHCLGLGHAHSDYDAVMGYSRTDYHLRLGADDIAGMLYLYADPKYGSTKSRELQLCGTVAGGATGSSAGLFYCLLPVFLAMVVRYRPRPQRMQRRRAQ